MVLPAFAQAQLDTAAWAPAHTERDMELLAHHCYYNTAFVFTITFLRYDSDPGTKSVFACIHTVPQDFQGIGREM
jgi:hypothetical protein